MTATLQRPVDGAAPPAAPTRPRVGALDALRGLAIGLMVFVNLRGSDDMPSQLRHSGWHGLTVADAVFPIFLFALGASLMLSARTRALGPATLRAVKLAVVGALLAALWHSHLPRPTFGVLPHIAAVSLLACLLLRLPRRRQVTVVVVGMALLVIAGTLSGWSPSTAWGVHLDKNLFGGFTPEGPQSWLGSVATVWFGVVAGRIVVAYEGTARRQRLLGWAALLLVSGLTLATIVPINKPLWTPSYALVGAGIAAILLVLMDVVLPLTRPLRLLGVNPIATYVVGESALWVVREHLWFPIRDHVEALIGTTSAALLYPTLSLALCLAMCAYLSRRGVRLRL